MLWVTVCSSLEKEVNRNVDKLNASFLSHILTPKIDWVFQMIILPFLKYVQTYPGSSHKPTFSVLFSS